MSYNFTEFFLKYQNHLEKKGEKVWQYLNDTHDKIEIMALVSYILTNIMFNETFLSMLGEDDDKADS